MMQSVTLRPVRVVPAWSPRLSQQATATATTPQPTVPATATVPPPAEGQEAPKPAFIDSALVAFGLDLVGVISLGALTYGARAMRSRNAALYGILCGAMGLKGLVDLSRIRER